MGTLLTVALGTWVAGNAYAAVRVANSGRNAREDRTPAAVGLAFRSVTYGRALPAWYVPGDSARPVIVIVHGYGGNRTNNLEVGPPLHRRGYGLLFIDLGYALGRHHYGGGQREANEVAAAVGWVKTHAGVPAVLLGYSAGGFAVLAAVARGTKVAAVIADSGFPGYRNEVACRGHTLEASTGLFPLLYPLVSGGGHALDVGYEVKDRPYRTPTLIIQGAADRVVSWRNGRRLARLTHGQLWLLPGVGHTTAFRRYPVTYIERLVAFLGSAH